MKSSLSNDEIGVIYTSKFKGNHHSPMKMSSDKANKSVASGSILWLYLKIKKNCNASCIGSYLHFIKYLGQIYYCIK